MLSVGGKWGGGADAAGASWSDQLLSPSSDGDDHADDHADRADRANHADDDGRASWSDQDRFPAPLASGSEWDGEPF